MASPARTSTFRTLVLACTLALPSAAAADEQAIMVFDASGSMWGQIEGRAKIEIARDAVGPALSGLPQEIELGLMVYGHRDKGSCEDIELVVEPAPGTARAIEDAVGTLRPKGKTPLTQSVRRAAEILRYTEEKATVILVTDGIESCEADPCALAAALERDGIDFTAHVVGFGLSEAEGRSVACLAEATGGRYIAAGDAASLGEALTATVAAAAEPVVAPEPVAPPEPDPLPFNLRATAVLAEGGEPFIEQDLRWIIAPAAAGADEETVYGGILERTLPAGDYRITARLADVVIEIPVTLAADALADETFVLGAGRVIATATRTPGGEAEEGATIHATYAGGREVGYGRLAHYVPAGMVDLEARIGNSLARETVSVAAGETVETVIVAASGIVAPTAVYAEGGPVVENNGIVFHALPAKAAIDGSRNRVETGYGAGALLDLPPGDYLLEARLDVAEARAPFTIRPGERTEVTVNLDAGVAVVEAPGAEVVDFLEAKGGIDGKRKRVERGYQESLVFTLPAGDYIIAVKRPEAEEVIERPLTVVAGERSEITVTP